MRKREKYRIDKVCGCAICENFHDFEFPKNILSDLYQGNLVLFAGAGISTEGHPTFPTSFYEDIKYELGLKSNANQSFASLMTRFCGTKNGRNKLLNKIKERLDYAKSFPEVFRFATRFHNELSTLFFIDKIITTNWDDYFETQCGAVPLVTAEDFAFWNIEKRTVLKIHGSINNVGSIVATSSDYKKQYKSLETGILGKTLTKLLKTKILIFVGYSFKDREFNKLYKSISKRINRNNSHAYIVTLDSKSDARFRSMGLTPIYTDATHFISVIKDHCISDLRMIGDVFYEGIDSVLDDVRAKHDRLPDIIKLNKCPDLAFCLVYQDGIMHALERIKALKNTGIYSDPKYIVKTIQTYFKLRKWKLSLRKYIDVAYIDGYINGVAYLFLTEELWSTTPLYYVYGIPHEDQPHSITAFKKLRKSSHTIHKSAYNHAKKWVIEGTRGDDQLIVHHGAFL